MLTGPTTGESFGVSGFGRSGLGGGSGDRLVTGSVGGFFGGFGPGPSANTAVALSKHRIATLIHIADLWVEFGFMGLLLSHQLKLSSLP